MKKILLLTLCMLAVNIANSQNINDNKVSFKYIQLPLIKINKAFTKYEVRVEHSYKQANEDSLAFFEQRKAVALATYETMKGNYQRQRDSLDRMYLRSLADWEKKTNAGTLTPSGQPLPKPNPPVFPAPPMFPNIKAPRLHTEYADENVKQSMALEGFDQGLGGVIVSIDLLPIRDIQIVQSKKGTGASTKYLYTCKYVQPISIKLESPTQGVLIDQVLLEATQSYKMKDQKSQYDHQLYMMDRADQFYTDLQKAARIKSLQEANSYLNNQVGYVKKTRSTEIYSVKKFKNYDYSDVTKAYSATIQALNIIAKDRDRSSAQDKLDEAMAQWTEIMIESNTYDNKARINDKVSAMIQCNIAEIQLWQSKFGEANATLDLAINAGVLKAKNHAKRMKSFYSTKEQRWNVNF